MSRSALVRHARFGVLVLLLAIAGGCARGCNSGSPPIHPNPNMDLQPKYRAQSASAFFADGATMRPPVEGTIARGDLALADDVLSGRDAADAFLTTNPFAGEADFLARGEERYGIYCTPCHGDRGDGRGMLWERAQVASADLREERIRAQPEGQLYDVITNGLGLMPGYRYPIPPRDRWAIVAWVRHLQAESGS